MCSVVFLPTSKNQITITFITTTTATAAAAAAAAILNSWMIVSPDVCENEYILLSSLYQSYTPQPCRQRNLIITVSADGLAFTGTRLLADSADDNDRYVSFDFYLNDIYLPTVVRWRHLHLFWNLETSRSSSRHLANVLFRCFHGPAVNELLMGDLISNKKD